MSSSLGPGNNSNSVPVKRTTDNTNPSSAAASSKNNPPHNNTPHNNSNKKHKNLRSLSHSLSWALRHKALELGFTMTSDGFVSVDEILRCRHAKFRGYSLDDIRQVVETNDKQLFKLEERPASIYYKQSSTIDQTSPEAERNNKDEDNSMLPPAAATILCIRANQGHTITTVDPELLLERLSPDELQSIPVIVHGTYRDAWQSIQQQGLNRMKRTHIHFASGLPKEDGVISGMRKSCQVYIYVDAAKCACDGVVFYRSDNGVLLTAGVNNEGTLPLLYFRRVTDNSGTTLLSHDD